MVSTATAPPPFRCRNDFQQFTMLKLCLFFKATESNQTPHCICCLMSSPRPHSKHFYKYLLLNDGIGGTRPNDSNAKPLLLFTFNLLIKLILKFSHNLFALRIISYNLYSTIFNCDSCGTDKIVVSYRSNRNQKRQKTASNRHETHTLRHKGP